MLWSLLALLNNLDFIVKLKAVTGLYLLNFENSHLIFSSWKLNVLFVFFVPTFLLCIICLALSMLVWVNLLQLSNLYFWFLTTQIRRQSITSLGVVCKGKPTLVPKVADILAQLLQMDDTVEVNCVNAALVALLRVHAKGKDKITGIYFVLKCRWFYVLDISN